MPIHLSFKNIRNSKAVSDHVHQAFEELIKITDDKFPFHVKLNKVADKSYHVGINCSYKRKQLSSKADHARRLDHRGDGANRGSARRS